jgi:TM2 domain-containing membrane protein YozV
MESLDKGVLPAWGFAEVVSLNTAYFMLTPFPWQMTSRERLAAYPQMMVWYILLALSLFGFARLALSKPGTALLLGVLVSAGVILQALAEGNIGAAFRHRDVFTAFFIIFASGVLAGIFHGGSRR